MEHRKEVAKKDRDGRGGHGPLRCAGKQCKLSRGEHGKKSLEPVSEQRQQRRFAVAGAEHVGRPRIARAVFVRIGQAERAAHHDGERHRTDKIRGDDDQHGCNQGISRSRVESAAILLRARLAVATT